MNTRRLTLGLAETCAIDCSGVPRPYVDAVKRGGHISLVLPYAEGHDACKQLLRKVDVLVLVGGGADVEPWRYGEESTLSSAPNPRRDAFEMQLFSAACEMRLPVVGICRGLQLINVALGGTLWQDLSLDGKAVDLHQRPDMKWEGVHEIVIAEGSRLHDVLDTTHLMVNSTHHQAINRLGRGLRVSARSTDGVIEAIEMETLPIVAVQFHPERLVGQPYDRLFADVLRWANP